MTRGSLGRRAITGGAALMAAALLAPALAAGAPATSVQAGDFSRTGVEFNAFYPGKITVTQGSSVTYSIVGFHILQFPKKGTKVAPLIVPQTTLSAATNDPAGTPYWWGGVTPVISFNPAIAAPSGGKAVTGAKTVSSGFPNGRAPKFTVSFPKKGTFQVVCVVHPNMRGSVTVVPKNSAAATTVAGAKARAAKEKAAQAKAAAAAARKADKTKGNTVSISPGNAKAQTLAFFPAKKTVAVGSAVTFTMSGRNEVHTVTFGPDAFVGPLAKTTYQGTSPLLASEGFYPSDPPAAGPPAVTPTSHGNGFVSSGAMSDPGTGIPLGHSFTVTFPTAGTYPYICMVHPEMQGTITVQ